MTTTLIQIQQALINAFHGIDSRIPDNRYNRFNRARNAAGRKAREALTELGYDCIAITQIMADAIDMYNLERNATD